MAPLFLFRILYPVETGYRIESASVASLFVIRVVRESKATSFFFGKERDGTKREREREGEGETEREKNGGERLSEKPERLLLSFQNK